MSPPGSAPRRLTPATARSIALLLAWALTAAPAGAEEPDLAAPNVLLIVADDLGWNDVAYHSSEIRTPNLDRLAEGGAKLEHHYVFPTCSPTRAALLTGRNPSRFGILGPIDGRSAQALPAGTPTLAGVLKSRGYATSMIGKWHLGLRPDVGPRRYGFDASYGYLHGQVDPETHLYKNGDRTWHRDDAFVEEPGHPTDLLADAAVRWIETRRDVPFFLDLAFSVPHTPLREDARWTAPYEGRFADPSRRLYAAAVTHMDDAIGRVVAAIDRTGQRERTMIVFTSDNGGQKDYTPGTDYQGRYPSYAALGDNAPLRGWKGSLYEGGVRVPAFANWPAKITPRLVTSTASALDWLPTLAALAGVRVDPRQRREGIDLWPALTGTGGPVSRRLYWKTGRDSAVREGDLKLIVPRRKGGVAELYDLAEDPGESKDLAPRHPDLVDRLLRSLREEQALDP